MDALYTDAQVAAVLRECNIDVEGETLNDFLCFCPFHGNTDSPAFSVSKTGGKYICFSPSCGVSGSLSELVEKTMKKTSFQALRIINKHAKEEEVTFADRLKKALSKQKGFVTFPQETLDRMYEDFWNYPKAIDYMKGRGFTEETLHHFRIGYSRNKKLNMDFIITPMHDINGVPIGLIGRGIDEKRFKNSLKLPTSQTLFNIHRVKRYDEINVVESNFDVMMMWQYGYPNTVASLGGHLGPLKMEQLKRFSTILPLTDNDPFHPKEFCRVCDTRSGSKCVGHSAGLELGLKMERELKGKRILWPVWSDEQRFPAKDIGEMTKEQIDYIMSNRQTSYEFGGGKRYNPNLRSTTV